MGVDDVLLSAHLNAAMHYLFKWYLRSRNPSPSPQQKSAITYHKNRFLFHVRNIGINRNDGEHILRSIEKSLDELMVELHTQRS